MYKVTDCPYCYGTGLEMPDHGRNGYLVCRDGCDSHNGGGYYAGGHSHDQVILRVGDQTAWVDRGMYPLLEKAWQDDIFTIASCEGTGSDNGFVALEDGNRLFDLLGLWRWTGPFTILSGKLFSILADESVIVRFGSIDTVHK